jgi:hypothetical protein
MDCLIGFAVALLVGFALPRRFRDWPAAIVLGTVGGLVAGIGAIVYLIPAISGFLTPTSEPVKTDATDLWSRASEHGSAEHSQLWPILISIVIGLIIAIAVWFAGTVTIRAGMWLRQLIGLARPSHRPASSGGRNAPNSTR